VTRLIFEAKQTVQIDFLKQHLIQSKKHIQNFRNCSDITICYMHLFDFNFLLFVFAANNTWHDESENVCRTSKSTKAQRHKNGKRVLWKGRKCKASKDAKVCKVQRCE